MLDTLKDEMQQVREALEDMWLDLSLDHDYLDDLQKLYDCAESLFDSGNLEAAQYWIHHFWTSLEHC